MLSVRRADERGAASFGWLSSRHTFSFGQYYDPQFMGFGPLRVINEDVVQPGRGFDPHGHRDMEILSYVLEGGLEHQDSMGNGSVIRPGDVQRMTAGTGVRHSEYNASATDPVHFLQIWIQPEREGLQPGYEQLSFSEALKRGQLCLVGSRDGRNGSVTIQQDVDLYATLLADGELVAHEIGSDRLGWVQVAHGKALINEREVSAGDGIAVESGSALEITGIADSEILLFDMNQAWKPSDGEVR